MYLDTFTTPTIWTRIGGNKPVVGATIRVDAFPEANAVTNASGYFILQNMPAPEFFVHI